MYFKTGQSQIVKSLNRTHPSHRFRGKSEIAYMHSGGKNCSHLYLFLVKLHLKLEQSLLGALWLLFKKKKIIQSLMHAPALRQDTLWPHVEP